MTLSGRPAFDDSSTILYGGTTDGNGAGDEFTGNTLNLWNYSGSAVASVQNFQYYNFVFPATQTGAVLTVTDTAFLSENGGANRSSTVTAGTIGGPGTSPMRPGSVVTLIDAGSGTLAASHFTQTQATGLHGATIAYLWDLDTDNNQLTATLRQVGARPEAKGLSQGYLAGMTLLNQGGDLVAGAGMSAAAYAADTPNTAYGLGVFGATSGGSLRHDTGSSIEMSSISLLAGVSKRIQTQPGSLLLGAFFEYGNGSYDTYSAFHGEGDVNHFGGGIIGRMDFAGAKTGHFYAEASFRLGSVDNSFDHSGLTDYLGREASFDDSSSYYGIHLAGGYIWNLTDKAALDLYGKYFWTRQDGDTLMLTTGDVVDFDAVNSHRLRFGGRFSYAVDQTIVPYAGLAWEHEFDGEAKATTYGYRINAPSLEGDTGMGEIGVSFRPSTGMPFSMDLGVQGYVGTREGVTGSLQLRYEF